MLHTKVKLRPHAAQLDSQGLMFLLWYACASQVIMRTLLAHMAMISEQMLAPLVFDDQCNLLSLLGGSRSAFSVFMRTTTESDRETTSGAA